MGDSENKKSDLSEFNKLLWMSLLFGITELGETESEEPKTRTS